MEKMITFCGLDCSVCPAYIATADNDDAARARVAEEWTKAFNTLIKPEDVNCDGCIEKGGRHFGYCAKCEIRKCGSNKEIENCAHCTDYACEKVNEFHAYSAPAKETLDEIRKSLLK